MLHKDSTFYLYTMYLFRLFYKFYKFINLLSIDVAIGSCTMAYLISEAFLIAPSPIVYFILFCSVWMIYTIDHLLDASNLKDSSIASRHQFHYKWKSILTIILGLLLVITVIISFAYLPLITIKYGLITCIFVGFHLILVKFLGNKVSLFVQKELSVALVYTLGISIFSVSLLSEITLFHFLFLAQCFLLAFINLCIFSFFDFTIDSRNSQTSIVRLLGLQKSNRLINLLLFSYILLTGVNIFNFSAKSNIVHQITLSIIWLILSFIFMKKSYFKYNDRYRLLGDFVFIIPVIVLI